MIPPVSPLAIVLSLNAALLVLALLAVGAGAKEVVLAVGGLAAVPLAVFVVRRPALAACALATVAATGIQDPLGGLGLPGFLLLVLLIGCIAAVRACVNGSAVLGWSPVYLAGAAWLLVQVAAALAAPRLTSLRTLNQYVVAAVVVLCLVTLCSVKFVLPLVLRTVVVAVSLLAMLTVVQQATGNVTDFAGFSRLSVVSEFGGFRRHSGPLSDPNFWARVLVLVLPLSAWAGVTATRYRLLWWSCPVALILALLLTGSRGGLVALLAVLVAAVFLAGPRVRQMVGLCLVAGVALLAVPPVGSMVAGLFPVRQAVEGTGDLSLVGRLEAQQYGLQLALANPVIGVGPGNFVAGVGEYREQYGTSFSGPPAAAHNTYLQMAAESGLLGLATWLLLGGTVLYIGLRDVLVLRARKSPPAAELKAAPALVLGVVGWAVSSVFLHLNQLVALAVVVALMIAIDQQVKQSVPAEPDEAPESPPQPAPDAAAFVRRAVIAVVLVEIFLVPAAWLAADERTAARWRASATISVVPHKEEVTAYDLDIVTRRDLVTTFAQLLALAPVPANGKTTVPPGVTLDVFPARGTSIITVETDAPTSLLARRVLIERAVAADAFLAASASPYRLERSSNVRVRRQDDVRRNKVALYVFGVSAVPLFMLVGAVALQRGLSRDQPEVALPTE